MVKLPICCGLVKDMANYLDMSRCRQQVIVMKFGKQHDKTDFCPCQLVMDLLRRSYGETGVMDLAKTCYGEVANLLWGSQRLVTDLLFMLRTCQRHNGEVANLLWTCYGETGVK